MKIYADTASLEEIKEAISYYPIAGVTTNPSLIAREGANYEQRILDIIKLHNFESVSIELISTEFDDMVEEFEAVMSVIREKAGDSVSKTTLNNVLTWKLPVTKHGVKMCKYLSSKKHKVNMTLIFNLNQAILAINAGANFVSPFVGRVDDQGYSGIGLIKAIKKYMASTNNSTTQIISASVRTTTHISDSARVGAHIVTMPTALLDSMLFSHLTDIGLQSFLDDYEQAKIADK